MIPYLNLASSAAQERKDHNKKYKPIQGTIIEMNDTSSMDMKWMTEVGLSLDPAEVHPEVVKWVVGKDLEELEEAWFKFCKHIPENDKHMVWGLKFLEEHSVNHINDLLKLLSACHVLLIKLQDGIEYAELMNNAYYLIIKQACLKSRIQQTRRELFRHWDVWERERDGLPILELLAAIGMEPDKDYVEKVKSEQEI
ncbi:hypothetical protein BGZ60DRAFT_395567 [Tricladium varicosporioides]|nr:hypothetical protein BGZ60DRAFT_395567 [Hymenoscyphus varicosporioides]